MTSNADTALVLLFGSGGPPGIIEGLKQMVGASMGKDRPSAPFPNLGLNDATTQAASRRVREQLLNDLADMGPHAAALEEELRTSDASVRPDFIDTMSVANELLAQLDSSADRKKRRLLAAALINSFDPALYRAGVTMDLLPRLRELTYPDVTFLASFGPNAMTCNSAIFTDTLGWSSARKLLKIDLIRESRDRQDLGPNSFVQITELGRQMLRFLRTP